MSTEQLTPFQWSRLVTLLQVFHRCEEATKSELTIHKRNEAGEVVERSFPAYVFMFTATSPEAAYLSKFFDSIKDVCEIFDWHFSVLQFTAEGRVGVEWSARAPGSNWVTSPIRVSRAEGGEELQASPMREVPEDIMTLDDAAAMIMGQICDHPVDAPFNAEGIIKSLLTVGRLALEEVQSINPYLRLSRENKDDELMALAQQVAGGVPAMPPPSSQETQPQVDEHEARVVRRLKSLQPEAYVPSGLPLYESFFGSLGGKILFPNSASFTAEHWQIWAAAMKRPQGAPMGTWLDHHAMFLHTLLWVPKQLVATVCDSLMGTDGPASFSAAQNWEINYIESSLQALLLAGIVSKQRRMMVKGETVLKFPLSGYEQAYLQLSEILNATATPERVERASAWIAAKGAVPPKGWESVQPFDLATSSAEAFHDYLHLAGAVAWHHFIVIRQLVENPNSDGSDADPETGMPRSYMSEIDRTVSLLQRCLSDKDKVEWGNIACRLF